MGEAATYVCEQGLVCKSPRLGIKVFPWGRRLEADEDTELGAGYEKFGECVRESHDTVQSGLGGKCTLDDPRLGIKVFPWGRRLEAATYVCEQGLVCKSPRLGIK